MIQGLILFCCAFGFAYFVFVLLSVLAIFLIERIFPY